MSAACRIRYSTGSRSWMLPAQHRSAAENSLAIRELARAHAGGMASRLSLHAAVAERAVLDARLGQRAAVDPHLLAGLVIHVAGQRGSDPRPCVKLLEIVGFA